MEQEDSPYIAALLDPRVLNAIADAVVDRMRNEAKTKRYTREEYAATKQIGLRSVDRMIQARTVRTERDGRRVMIVESK